MNSCVLLKFGEIVLKGRNRVLFYAQLRRNVQRLLRSLGPLGSASAGVLAVLSPAPVGDSSTARGVYSSQPPSPGARARQDAGGGMRGRHRSAGQPAGRRSCSTRARAATELAPRRTARHRRRQGGAGRARARRRSHAPRPRVHLEVDKQGSSRSRSGFPVAGLPVGVSGRAVCLLSGGIDSPVAAYRAMKRGLRCEFVHFSGRPFTGPSRSTRRTRRRRSSTTSRAARVFTSLPFGNVQREVATAGAARLQVIAQRRLMMRTASALAEREVPRLSSRETRSGRCRRRRSATSPSSRMPRRCPCSARS